MTDLVIEKGIPIPRPVKAGCVRSAKLVTALRQMVVGDSVLSPYEENTTRSTAVVAGKAIGGKFTVRREGQSFRIWRIA